MIIIMKIIIIIIHFSGKKVNMSVVNGDKTFVIVVETSLSGASLENDVIATSYYDVS